MGTRSASLVTLVAAVILAGCGNGGSESRSGTPSAPLRLHLRPDQRPTPIGVGPRYRIAPTSPAVARGRPVTGHFRCVPSASLPHAYGVHLELFARGRVVIVPAGIGIAPPQRRRGAYVLGGACTYPIRTLDPTGVVRISLAPRTGEVPTLRDLFAIWGQRLTRARLASFHGHVRAFVAGRAWRRQPGAIPLARHAEIVLEVGARIPPHPSYRFPPGL